MTRSKLTSTPAAFISFLTSDCCSGQHQRDDGAVGAGAGGAARAVQVRLVLGRRVDVDDQLDVVDVDAAGGDVGGDQHADGAGGERGEVAVAGVLRQVAVQVDRGDAGVGQRLGQLPGAVLGAGEEHAAAGAGGELDEQLLLGGLVVDAPARGASSWSTAACGSSTEWVTGLVR